MSDHPPVGFTSPGDPPPPQGRAPAARPARKPILRLVQKFWKDCTEPTPAPDRPEPPEVPEVPDHPEEPVTPVIAPVTPVTSGNGLAGNPPVIAGNPPVIPPQPPEIIRIEATNDPQTWLFSTIPAPIGIEGIIKAASSKEAIQKVSQAIRGLQLRCNPPDGLVCLALLVNPESLVAATRMTPDVDGEREVCNAKIV